MKNLSKPIIMTAKAWKEVFCVVQNNCRSSFSRLATGTV